MKIKRLAAIGMLCALAYSAAAVGRVPVVLFLKYDPKDIVIALGGFVFGPFAAFAVALAASLAEMITVSENGLLGLVMNVLSSCAFACTAAFIYRNRPTPRSALFGLLCGWACMVITMMGWNYFIAPIYMGCSRRDVAALLLPAFLPFNLLKGGLNTAATLLLYRPVIKALRSSGMME